MDHARLPEVTMLPASPDESLERFARLVRASVGVPVALVSLVSADEQVFPGALGLPEPWQTRRATPLTHSFCQYVVRSGRPLVVRDAREDPVLRDSPAIPDLGVVAYAGYPLVMSGGEVVGSLCAIDTRPRDWSAEDQAVLADLAQACSAQLQVRAAEESARSAVATAQQLLAERDADRRRWEIAIDAAGIGSFDWDLVAGTVTADRQLLAIYGITDPDPEQLVLPQEFFTRHVLPDDLDRVRRAVAAAVETDEAYAVECRLVLTDATVRWVQVRGHVVRDDDGAARRILGATYDTTAVHAGEARTARVLDSMPAGYLSLDHQARFTVVNDAAEVLLGRRREDLLGTAVGVALPAEVGDVVVGLCRSASDSGQPQTEQVFHPAPVERWLELMCWATPDGHALFFVDTTTQVHTTLRAESAAARLAMFAGVNRSLVDTADLPRAMQELSALLVPALADGCVVTLMQEDGRPVDVGSWHADPGQRAVLARYTQTRIAAQSLTSPLARALASGDVVHASTQEVLDSLAAGEARDLLTALDAGHAFYVPVHGRDRIRGALSLFSAGSRPRDAADEQAARDVADRVGLALDNAALLTAQSQVAEGLQRSLLTDPPEPDHAQVVVRYVPAAEAAKVGGDWYDAFLQPSGNTMLVIGDVVGHDIAAAAAMGQLRGLLRGIAAYSDAGPAEVLRGLDAAMQVLQVSTLATAAVARFEQTPDELERGVTRMVWSNAGHPPPVVIHPDGTLAVLAEWRGDLLLGVDPHTRRTEQTITLDRGATILLYTDGLVERRASTLDDDTARLQQAIVDTGAGTLDELCDGIVARLVGQHNEDDIALVAVRLHPQDRPRPAEAGPNDVPPELPPDPAHPTT